MTDAPDKAADAEAADDKEWTTAPADAGERLDKWLAGQAKDLSRSRIQQLLEQGHIMLDGHPASAKQKLRAGQRITIALPPPVPLELQPLDLPLDILFEDDQLLVINKPAGLTVHPAAGHQQDTLVNALLHHCGDSLSGIGGVERPGIVHRLDKDTSGLMLVAKTDRAHQHLSSQLQDRSLSRRYIAWVWGVPKPKAGMWEGNIGRSPANRQKMTVLRSGGKEARTHYSMAESFLQGRISRLELTLDTGRTHQIRVHATEHGHPLLGDPVYGSCHHRNLKACPAEVELAARALNRQALHAAAIRFIHPTREEAMQFACPLPPDLLRLEACLSKM